VGALRPTSPLRHWVWSEVNLWVIAIVVLGLALAVRRQRAGNPVHGAVGSASSHAAA
jgi:hypothetical protein